MAVRLFDLLHELEGLVPAQDGTPSTAQYLNQVKDAAVALSHKAGMKKLFEFNVVSGTAEYTLPDDFLKLIKFEELTGQYPGLLVQESGLVPLNTLAVTNQCVIAGRTLTIVPTPTYSLTRYLWYKAGHVLTRDEDDREVYEDMTYEVSRLVLAKATASAWRVVGGRVARDQAWKYQIGDVMIDKTNLTKSLSGWISDLDKEFESRVKDYLGNTGMRG
jgi:hypothetical protein